MTRPTITIGGLAGTGTSTLSRLVAARLDLPYVYTGAIFREQAAQRGLTVEEFNLLCQQDPAVDRSLDDEQLRLLRLGELLLEGRMAGWIAATNGDVDALGVWVVCDEEERIRRIVARDGGDATEALERTRQRETSELARYRRYYGADIVDRSHYDLVLDSTASSPEQLAARVVAAVGQRTVGQHS